MSKFDRIQKYLDDYWGFTLYRADPASPGRYIGAWKTGYIVQGNLHGAFMYHYRTLKEIEKSWMMKDRRSNPIK